MAIRHPVSLHSDPLLQDQLTHLMRSRSECSALEAPRFEVLPFEIEENFRRASPRFLGDARLIEQFDGPLVGRYILAYYDIPETVLQIGW